MDPGIDLPRAASQENMSKSKQAGVYAETDLFERGCARYELFLSPAHARTLRASGM